MYTQTTVNFANKRNIDITEWDVERAAIWEASNDFEPLVIYRATGTGFLFDSAPTLPSHIREEIPAHVRDEKHLRQVIDFIVKSL